MNKFTGVLLLVKNKYIWRKSIGSCSFVKYVKTFVIYYHLVNLYIQFEFITWECPLVGLQIEFRNF